MSKEVPTMLQASQGERPGLQNLEWYRIMRDSDPVWRDPKTGLWNVFRYEDVAVVLTDYRTFSSDFSQFFPEQAELIEGNIVATDPPYHHQLRHLVSQAFTPRAIARLQARIGELTEELLDQTGGRTYIELVEDLAYPLPVTVIAELLGVPATDRSRFKTWADALLAQSNADPTDIEGKRLSDQEIVGFATTLLLAGHITTTALLGNTILCLDEHSQTQAALRANPAAIPGAIEEVLRYRSPVVQTGRVTTIEVRLGEQVIAPQQMLMVQLHSANHDHRRFENPDEFLFDRDPNPHVGFGKGIHFCLGAPWLVWKPRSRWAFSCVAFLSCA